MKAQWLASALQKLSRPAGLSTAISAGLIEQIQKSACQNDQGFHGLSHWLRVLQNGRELAKATGANLKVVELFAVIHDSQRRNENHDPFHGYRAAEYAREVRGTWFELTDAEMNLLQNACIYHSDGLVDAELTVQVCWDADRLDLGRVGIRPSAEHLCTDHAKIPEVIEAAYRRSKLPVKRRAMQFHDPET